MINRGITDIAKRLDEQKSRALTITDLFTPSGETLRGKLKDYCVRLITKDPVGYARKTEELLWRKAFYDIVYASKKLRKVLVLYIHYNSCFIVISIKVVISNLITGQHMD